jgi:hypothetical protein
MCMVLFGEWVVELYRAWLLRMKENKGKVFYLKQARVAAGNINNIYTVLKIPVRLRTTRTPAP